MSLTHAVLSCMTFAVQVVALLEEYFNSGDVEEATSTLQVTISLFADSCAELGPASAREAASMPPGALFVTLHRQTLLGS